MSCKSMRGFSNVLTVSFDFSYGAAMGELRPKRNRNPRKLTVEGRRALYKYNCSKCGRHYKTVPPLQKHESTCQLTFATRKRRKSKKRRSTTLRPNLEGQLLQ